MNRSIEKTIAVGFGLAFTLLFAVGVVQHGTTGQLVEAGQRVAHTDVVLAAIQTVLADVKGAESWLRGYAATGDDKFLAPCRAAINETPNHLRQLRQLTLDNPRQQRWLDTLEPLVARRFNHMERVIELRKNRGLPAASDFMLQGEGIRLTNEINQIIADMEKEERGLLAQRTAALETDRRTTNAFILVGSFLAIGLLFASGWIVYRDLFQRKRAEAALRESQALTNAIVDSTSDLIWSVDHEGFGLLTFNHGLSDNLLRRGIRLRPGMRPEDVFADRDLADRWRGLYQRALLEDHYAIDYESPTAGVLQTTFNLLKRDGKVFGIAVFGRDITERKRSEVELHRLNEALIRSRQELELRVQERTAELRDANEQLRVELAERQRAEEALRESERRERARAAEFEALMEAAPVGIFRSDDTECRWMSGNRAACNLLRRPRGANLSKSGAEDDKPVNFRAMKDGKEIPLWELPMQKTAATGQAIRDHEMDFVFEDGDTVNVLGNVVPLLDESGRPRGAVGTFLDITGRKRAEEALRASEERFRVLSEAMPQIVWSADASGAIDYYNPRAIEYGGLNPEVVYGWNWAAIIHPDDLEATQSAWRRALVTGETSAIEHRLRRADGQFRWHLTRAVPLRDAEGQVVRWIGTATDIHEKELAEEELERRVGERTAELAKSKALLETVTSNAPVILFATDAQGVFTVHTGKAALATGLEAGEFIGKYYQEVLSNSSPSRENIRRALTGEEFTDVVEGPVGAAFEVRYTPLRDADGKIAGMIGLSLDITERKEAEGRLRESEEKYRTLFNSIDEGFCTIEVLFDENNKPADYRFLEINPSFEKQTGIQNARGRRMREIAPQHEEHWFEIYGNIALTGEPVRFENEAAQLHRWYEVYAFRIGEPQQKNVAVLFNDITERKRAEVELRRVNRALKTLTECNEAMVRASEESDLLERVCRLLAEEGGHRLVWVGYADQDEAKSVRPVAHAGFEEGYLDTVSITWADEERGRGPTGTAIRTGQPCVARNYREDPKVAPWRAEATRRGYASSLGLPLIANGRTLGALTLYSQAVDAFDGKEVSLLEDLATDLAFGIHTLRAETERKRAMETLEKQAAQLREQTMLLDLAPAAIFVRDMERRIVYWNHGAEEIYGWSREEALGNVTHMLLRTQFPKPLAEIEAEALCDGLWEGELLSTKRGGEPIVVASRWASHRDGQGNFVGFLECNLDITKRKRAEEALRESEERYRSVVTSMAEGVVLQDRTGAITAWNKSAEHILGLTSEEIAGRMSTDQGWRAIHEEGTPFPGADHPAMVALRTAQPQTAIRMGVHKPDGALRWILVNAEPIFGPDKSLPQAVVATFSDITERKQAEEEIRRLNEDLERRVRERTAELEAMNKELEAFTYSVSHDLRAPLRHIDGFSRLLQEECSAKLDDTAQHYLDRIQAATLSMGRLIDDLLSLSRIGRREATLKLTGLGSLVKEVLNEFESETRGRRIEWKVGGLPFAECDPSLIKLVFRNLLSNALKFTRPRDVAVIEVGETVVNGQPAIFVRDNGVGFSMKYADKLFGVFQRLHREADFEGTGVGLATVQRIIHKHSGQTWAEGEINKGATFFFTLPGTENQEEPGKLA